MRIKECNIEELCWKSIETFRKGHLEKNKYRREVEQVDGR